jgi:hypothetical protein
MVGLILRGFQQVLADAVVGDALCLASGRVRVRTRNLALTIPVGCRSRKGRTMPSAASAGHSTSPTFVGQQTPPTTAGSFTFWMLSARPVPRVAEDTRACRRSRHQRTLRHVPPRPQHCRIWVWIPRPLLRAQVVRSCPSSGSARASGTFPQDQVFPHPGREEITTGCTSSFLAKNFRSAYWRASL